MNQRDATTLAVPSCGACGRLMTRPRRYGVPRRPCVYCGKDTHYPQLAGLAVTCERHSDLPALDPNLCEAAPMRDELRQVVKR